MLERVQGAIYPNLRDTRVLGLACDFSGQHRTSRFDTYSFLLFDLEKFEPWERERARVRSELIGDSRRVAYKNLRDNVQWAALEPFLNAAGQLPGILLTVAVEKRFAVSFVVGPGLNIDEFEDTSKFNEWPTMTVVKAMWVIHTAALLVAGFGAKGQNLLWAIDEDEIVDTEERRKVVSTSFRDVVSDYLSFDMGTFHIVTARDDTPHRRIEDLLSVADLAAGAWSDMFNTITTARDLEDLHRIVAAKGERSRQKAELLTGWCSRNSQRPLKYMSIMLTAGDADFPVYMQAQFARPTD